jgi:chemotaxis protein MotB
VPPDAEGELMHSFEFEEEPIHSVPEWFVTFADMMSLLLAFFIMLVSMSNFESPKQFQSLVTLLQEQFGHTPAHGEAEKNLVVAARGDDIPDALQQEDTLPGGIILFEELATDLTEANKRDLHQIAQQLNASEDRIEIRGHATQITIEPHSGIRDVWDLADRRCHSTMKFLIEQGIDSNRMRLANAGMSEPLYNGTDLLRLRENSRVEIRLLEEGLDRF